MTTTLSHGRRLTTDSSSSSYGIPVLEYDMFGTGEQAMIVERTLTLGPADELPHYPGKTAAEYVAGWLGRSTQDEFDCNVRGVGADPTTIGTLAEAQDLARRFVAKGGAA